MCLECGFYNGRQVMDLKAQKEKRTARMQAKKEVIKAQANIPSPEVNEVVEETSEKEEKTEKAKAKKVSKKKPEKQVE